MPVIPMLVIVSAAVPVLVSVEFWATLVVPTCCEPNEMLVGLSVTDGALAAPVPLNATLCGLSIASSVIDTLALRAPVADGENVTESVQEAPAASVVGLSGHVEVSPKSELFVPVTAMLLIVSGALPEFVNVTV